MEKKTEELGKKLKGFWNKVTNDLTTGPSFKGSGHRLGGAEEAPAPSQPSRPAAPQPARPGGSSGGRPNPPQQQQQQQGPRASGAAAATAAAAAAAEQRVAAAAARGAGQRGAAARAAPAGPKPQAVLLPAAEFDPFQPAVGGGAALNAIKDPPAEALAAAGPSTSPAAAAAAAGAPAAAAAAASRGGAASSPGGVPPAARPPGRRPTAEQVGEIRHCVALILSMPSAQAAASVEVLSKLLGNLLALPEEPKLRQVRLGNKRIREAVVDVPGGCALLAACGFEVHPEAGAEDGGFAAFLEDERLPLVEEGLLQLQSLAAAASPSRAAPPAAAAALPPGAAPAREATGAAGAGPGASAGGTGAGAAAAGGAAAAAAGAPAAAAAPQPPPPERQVQIILPVASDIQLDASFFERTPADVKAEYARMAARRRAGEVLATRATREAAAAAARGPPPKEAAVRVRFPEGIQLEATFGVAEPLARVHETVAAALRNPAALFELVLPDRRPLPREGRVYDASIAPSVLLNFRGLEAGGGAGAALPALSDEMLRRARVG